MQPIHIITTVDEAVPHIIDALATQGVDASTATAGQLIALATMGAATLEKPVEELLDKILVGIRNHSILPTGVTLNEFMSRELIDRWKSGRIKLAPPKKTKGSSVKYDPGQYLKALEDFCFFQAIYDLLSGKLHRLDPVIGDQGCQWRVPFVLDAQGELFENLRQHKSLPFVAPFVADVLAEYENAILVLSQNPEFFRFLNFEIYCRQYWEELDLITQEDKADALWQKAQKSSRGSRPVRTSPFATKDQFLEACDGSLQKCILEIKKAAPLFFEVHEFSLKFFEIWNKDEFTSSAKDYLTCCKLLTLRVKRRVDCFGLSSVPHEIILPADEKIINRKYTSLATCSWEYMDYISRVVCEKSGNKVTWVERGKDIWDYTYEGDNNSLSVSIHKCLQVGYSTTQAGASYFSHLFFGPIRLIFMYQYCKNQPIIIDHRRLKCTVLNTRITHVDPDGKKPDETFNDATYELLGSEILYFEPTAFGAFTYVPNPTVEQQIKVGMCVETYSIITAGDTTLYPDEDMGFKSENPDEYFAALKNAPIVNLILMAASTHPELPGNCKIRGKYTSDTNVSLAEAIQVYETCTLTPCTNQGAFLTSISGQSVPFNGAISTDIWDIKTEKLACVSLLRNRCPGETEYRHVLPGRTTGRRLAASMPFGAIHIYGCTFAVKVQEMNAMLGDPDQAERRRQGVGRLMTGDLDTDRPK